MVFGDPIKGTSYKELDIKELRDLISKKAIELKKGVAADKEMDFIYFIISFIVYKR